jgi:RHS repeat-associated protein
VEPGMNYKIKIETTNGQFSDESDNFFNLSGQDDHGISVIQTNDDGYVFVGYSNSFTHGGYDFLTYKLDANGNKQWRKNFGGLYPDTAHSIQQTADNGFIVAGETKSFVHGTIGEDSDFLVYKLDANGNKQWRKNFGGLYPDTAHSIQQTADNGFIVAGETKSFVHGTIGEDSDFLIYKLDDGGNKQWRKNYGGGEIWETTGQSYAPTNSLEKGKNNKNGEHKDSLQNDAFPPYNSNQGGPFVGDVLNSTSNTSIINKKTSKSGISNPKLKTSSKTRKILSEPLYNTYYIYSYDGKLMAEYDHNRNCMRDYIYVGNKLLAEYQPQTGKYYYYMNDQINSTRLVTDDIGNVAYSAAHGPFGGAQKTWTNTYDPRLKYSGKEREGYTDFDYFGARYYDHNSYRFISTDPIINKEEALTNPQLWNLYAYCRNNPITYLDPDGRAENSLSNIWERIKISFTALKYEGSTAWAKNKKKDDFGRGKYKCNKFVYDVTKEAGALAEIKIGNKTYRLPRAGEWANKNAKIANWRVLKSGEKIHPGDVAAYKLSGGGREFSGHTGIMIMNKKSKFTNISAHVEDISTVPNQFLGNRDTVYRRYTGD